MRQAETVRVVHDHEGGEIPDFHEVIWLGKSVLRDRNGRRHRNGWHRFAALQCNNPGCLFEALVSEGSIIARLTEERDG